jgi:hypothetical protein
MTENIVAQIDGRRYIVSRHPSYEVAYPVYDHLWTAQREGRLLRADPAPYDRHGWGQWGDRIARLIRPPYGDWLAIRNGNDPGWSGLPTVKLLVADSSRGSRSINGPARRVAARKGAHAEVGGWVYNSNGRPIIQGWHAYAMRYLKPSEVFYDPDRRVWLAAAS